MTPDELLEDLRRLITAYRFPEAVDLTVRRLPEVRSQMTPEQAVRLHELMHVADVGGDLDGPPAAETLRAAEAQPTR